MKDYKNVIDDVDYWWLGSYSQNKLPKKYAFNSGILKHEYKHFLIESSNVITTFNDFFQTIFNGSFWRLDKNTFPCPKDALAAKKPDVIFKTGLKVSECFNRFKNLSKFDRKQEELGCDKFARVEYDSIKVRINRWAVNQIWYKP